MNCHFSIKAFQYPNFFSYGQYHCNSISKFNYIAGKFCHGLQQHSFPHSFPCYVTHADSYFNWLLPKHLSWFNLYALSNTAPEVGLHGIMYAILHILFQLYFIFCIHLQLKQSQTRISKAVLTTESIQMMVKTTKEILGESEAPFLSWWSLNMQVVVYLHFFFGWEVFSLNQPQHMASLIYPSKCHLFFFSRNIGEDISYEYAGSPNS